MAMRFLVLVISLTSLTLGEEMAQPDPQVEQPQFVIEPQFIYANSRNGLVDSYGAPVAPVDSYGAPIAPVAGPWKAVNSGGSGVSYSQVPVYGEYQPQYDYRNQQVAQPNGGFFGFNTGLGADFSNTGIFNPHTLLTFGLGAVLAMLVASIVIKITTNIFPTLSDFWSKTEEARSLENVSTVAGYVFDAFEKYGKLDSNDNE